MSTQWPGGILSKTPPTVTAPVAGEGGSASGMWTMTEAMTYSKTGSWPKPAKLRQLWVWGKNDTGHLGTGNTTSLSSPVQVGSLTDWSQHIAGGEGHSAAVKADGTFWTWGQNTNGQLGQGNTTNLSSPVQLGSLTDWAYVEAMGASCLSVKTDGTLWTWGYNHNGQLGNGAVASISSPIQIGSLTTWGKAQGAGSSTILHVKTDGALWAWGTGSVGVLGNGATAHKSSPIQIGSLTNWATVDAGNGPFAAAVKTDGTLWTWGENSYGTLGHGNTTNLSSPVQVGSLTTWYSARAGDQALYAIKTDGTLWVAGRNTGGRLADGSTTHRSSLVQVGALTIWASVNPVAEGATGFKTNGTKWSWGECSGNLGTTGQGNNTTLSEPTQVGSATDWITANYLASGNCLHNLHFREG